MSAPTTIIADDHDPDCIRAGHQRRAASSALETTSKPRKIARTSTVTRRRARGGHAVTCLRVTRAATISSSQSSATLPSTTSRPSSDAIARRAAGRVHRHRRRDVVVLIVTPSETTSRPGSVSCSCRPSAARSAITEPGRIHGRLQPSRASARAGPDGRGRDHGVELRDARLQLVCCAACCSGVSSCA